MNHYRKWPVLAAGSACGLVAGFLLAVGAGAGAVTSATTPTATGCLENSAPHEIFDVSQGTPITCPGGSTRISWPLTAPSPSPSPTSPSPSATTPTPTPTTTSPSSTPSPTPSPTTAACVTSADNGGCGPYLYSGITASNGFNTYVNNNIWNPIAGFTQTLTSFDPGHESVVANCSGSCAGNTAVVSYPEIQQLYTLDSNNPDPLSNFKSIMGSFTDTGVSGPGDYEWAYDIWAGTAGNNGAQEIMIWTDNHGQTPAGNDLGNVTIGGLGYHVWSPNAVNTNTPIVTLVADSQFSSGSVDLLTLLNWLVTNGYSPAGTGVNQIDYGPEICNTGGTSETFGVSAYTLTTS